MAPCIRLERFASGACENFFDRHHAESSLIWTHFRAYLCGPFTFTGPLTCWSPFASAWPYYTWPFTTIWAFHPVSPRRSGGGGPGWPAPALVLMSSHLWSSSRKSLVDIVHVHDRPYKEICQYASTNNVHYGEGQRVALRTSSDF